MFLNTVPVPLRAPESIAGHVFVNGQCACGRWWRDIWHVDKTYTGAGGYAHSGVLSETGAEQIQAAKAAQDERFEKAP